MMIIQLPNKTTREKVDYQVDFASRVTFGDGLAAGSCRAVIPGGASISVTNDFVSGSKVQFRLEGGSIGECVVFTIEVDTTEGQLLDQEFRVFVKDEESDCSA